MFNDTFLKACRSEPTDHIPVWFMRQAGRSLPGYRELRKTYDVITLTQTPELAAQVSREPVERLGVDAAILFADIMLLPIALGVDLQIVDSVGPVINNPITNINGINALRPFDRANIAYLEKTIGILRETLEVPVIGFSAAPFTIASYLIEGSPTRNWVKTKRFMLEHSDDWDHLMSVLSNAIIGYLSAQVDAGAQAVQIFDSWVGCLSPEDYRMYVLPHVQRIFSAIKPKGVPRIHFGTDTAGMLADFSNVDAEVIGLDWRIDLAAAKKIIGAKAMQGNLDPVAMLADERVVKAKIDRMVGSLPSRDGFIFNLGHGVMPESNDVQLKNIVEYIHGK
jgi:uroporphyrinogen decarboxylase